MKKKYSFFKKSLLFLIAGLFVFGGGYFFIYKDSVLFQLKNVFEMNSKNNNTWLGFFSREHKEDAPDKVKIVHEAEETIKSSILKVEDKQRKLVEAFYKKLSPALEIINKQDKEHKANDSIKDIESQLNNAVLKVKSEQKKIVMEFDKELSITLEKIKNAKSEERNLASLQEAEKKINDLINRSQDEQKKLMIDFDKKISLAMENISIKESEIRKMDEQHRKIVQELDKKLSLTMDKISNMAEEQAKTVARIDSKIKILENKGNNELVSLTNKMLVELEAKFYEEKKDSAERNRLIGELYNKLQTLGKNHESELKEIHKKLSILQNEQMSSEKNPLRTAIKQRDIDDLVKVEVKQQLNSLKKNGDPRVARLKKIMALEKMRRIIKGFVDGDSPEDLNDF